MDVDSFGDTQARSTTIVNRIVQHIDLPPDAVIPPTSDEIAWGTQQRADEDMHFMHFMIDNLRRNATVMNPVVLLEQRRMLEQSAASGSAAAQMALSLLASVLSRVQDSLVICHVCGCGSNPGVQHCPHGGTAFTTLRSRAQEIVDSSASSLLGDAATAVIDRGRESDPNRHHEAGSQPVDMDGTFPQTCRPGRFGPLMLNITYFVQEDIAEQTQAQERPPLNQKRTGLEGSFRFLAKTYQQKMKAIANEPPERKAELERKRIEDVAMDEFKKAVVKGFLGCADRNFQNTIKRGGPEAKALLDHALRRRTLFVPDEVITLADSIQQWEKCRQRECCFRSMA